MPPCHRTGVQSSVWLVDASVSGKHSLFSRSFGCHQKAGVLFYKVERPVCQWKPPIPSPDREEWLEMGQPGDSHDAIRRHPVLNLQRPASGFLRVTWQIPAMCERRREASLLVDSVSSKLHHFTPPPSQQTLTLFCDYLASSFPNVHQIKELLGHGRTCLWGRIFFKVTAQPKLTLLVFIQSM